MSVSCDFACLYEYEESIGGGSRGARASSRWTAVPVPHGEVSSSRDMAGLHFRGRRWRYRLAQRRLAAVSAESLLSVDANLGQHTNTLDRAARERARCSSLCVERSDRSKEPVRPVAGENRRRPTNANPGGTRQGRRT